MAKTESMYLQDDEGTCRCSVVIGCKGAGKSYFVLAAVQFALKHNLYDRYTLIIPAWENEQNDSYAWLKQYADIVDVYADYSPTISEIVVKQSLKKSKKTGEPIKQFYCIDDSTSFLKDACFIDECMNAIITKSRHLRVSFTLIMHAMKNIISPALRSNMDFCVLYKITNAKALTGIWEEFYSMMPEFPTFRAFQEYYLKHVLESEHNALFLRCLKRIHCLTESFQWIKDYNPKMVRPRAAKPAPTADTKPNAPPALSTPRPPVVGPPTVRQTPMRRRKLAGRLNVARIMASGDSDSDASD